MKPFLTSIPASSAWLGTFAFVLSLSVTGGDWPHWRGPRYTGISAETGLQASFSDAGPKVLWKADVGTGYASVSVADGRAYTVGNKNKKDAIYCFDAATGREIWNFSYAHPLDAKYYDGGPSATPTVDGQQVYAFSKRGQLHCLDASTGAVKWKKNLTEELGFKVPEWGFASSVLIDGNRAVVNVGTHGAAFDKATGNVLWKSGTAESGYATPVPFEQDGQRLYLVFAARELAAVRAETGQKAWSHPWKTSHDVNAADPVIVGSDRVFISSGYERGGAMLEVKGGRPKVIWENKNIRCHFNAGLFIGGNIYAIDGNTDRAQLRCVDAATGEVRWTLEDSSHGAITAADGKLIVISEKGELIMGQAKPDAFEPLARAQVSGGNFWTVPVLAHGRLYVRNAEGRVTCLDVGAKPLASVP